MNTALSGFLLNNSLFWIEILKKWIIFPAFIFLRPDMCHMLIFNLILSGVILKENYEYILKTHLLCIETESSG